MTIEISHELHFPAGTLYARYFRAQGRQKRLGEIPGLRARLALQSIREGAPSVLVNGYPASAPVTFSSDAYSAALGGVVSVRVKVTP